MKPIFVVEVILDEIQYIQGYTGEVTMILFHGNCKSDIFQGKHRLEKMENLKKYRHDIF